MAQQKRKSGGARKYGRNKEKCRAYGLALRRFQNKLRRIRKTQGEEVASAYERAGAHHAKRYVRRHGGAE